MHWRRRLQRGCLSPPNPWHTKVFIGARFRDEGGTLPGRRLRPFDHPRKLGLLSSGTKGRRKIAKNEEREFEDRSKSISPGLQRACRPSSPRSYLFLRPCVPALPRSTKRPVAVGDEAQPSLVPAASSRLRMAVLPRHRRFLQRRCGSTTVALRRSTHRRGAC